MRRPLRHTLDRAAGAYHDRRYPGDLAASVGLTTPASKPTRRRRWLAVGGGLGLAAVLTVIVSLEGGQRSADPGAQTAATPTPSPAPVSATAVPRLRRDIPPVDLSWPDGASTTSRRPSLADLPDLREPPKRPRLRWTLRRSEPRTRTPQGPGASRVPLTPSSTHSPQENFL